MTAEKLADEMDENVEDVRDMLKIRRMSMLDVEQDTMTLEEFLTFITDEILPNKTYSAAIDEDMRSEIENGETQIRENRELMLGKKYNRMIISTKYPSEGNSTFACMGELQKKAKRFDKRAYFVGDSAMGYEMDEGFTDELNFVTLLTIIAILLVVLVTFRSFVSSAALVAIIQAAVFITTAIVTLQGYSTNYVALILVQCILMGATIDYGILLFDNYREMRIKLDKEKAAAALIRKSDKKRSAYYAYHTGRDWGKASDYDFCVNTATTGMQTLVDLCKKFIGEWDRKTIKQENRGCEIPCSLVFYVGTIKAENPN